MTRKNSRKKSRKNSRIRRSARRSTLKTSKIIINSIKWGSVSVKQGSKIKNFKDVVIEPDKFYEWDFKNGFDPSIDKEYTGHQFKINKEKGIQPHSVRNLLHLSNIFILTTGFHDDLGVNKDTIKFLEKNGKKVIVVNSKDVMDTYNKLSKKEKVVALVHSTC